RWSAAARSEAPVSRSARHSRQGQQCRALLSGFSPAAPPFWGRPARQLPANATGSPTLPGWHRSCTALCRNADRTQGLQETTMRKISLIGALATFSLLFAGCIIYEDSGWDDSPDF